MKPESVEKKRLADHYFRRGNARCLAKAFELAIEDFDKAIALDPELVPAYNIRGNAYRGKGELERAIEDYNTAIKLKPDYAYAYNNRGQCLSR